MRLLPSSLTNPLPGRLYPDLDFAAKAMLGLGYNTQMMVVALLSAFLLGSLPLGSGLLGFLGQQRALTPHTLGPDSFWRTSGFGALLLAFMVDAGKGFVAVWAANIGFWALLAAYLGHLYPPPWRKLTARLRGGKRWPLPRPLRGRGVGVLTGGLLALAATQQFSWLSLCALLFTFALLLALTRYLTVAFVGALLLLELLSMSSYGVQAALPVAAITLLGLWRVKAALARMVDGTEPRLRYGREVTGAEANEITAAFMIHPLEIADLWQPRSLGYLLPLHRQGWLQEGLIRKGVRLLRPQLRGEITGIRLTDGRRMRVLLIAGPLLPDQIRSYPQDAVRMCVQAAHLSQSLGAEVFGLGAFWSTVGNKGLEVQAALPQLPMTNGGAYTAATVRQALPGIVSRFSRKQGELRQQTAAVVGANGVVAFGVARLLAPEVGRLMLVGRDPERTARSAKTLQRKYPACEVVATTDLAALKGASLIVSATSDPAPVIFAEHVTAGAWIYDLGRPADVDDSVLQVPGVTLIPGGMVRPPGKLISTLDLHFGTGMVPACLAETMILAATGAYDKKSLGPQTKDEHMSYFLKQGDRLGFEIVTDDPAKPLAGTRQSPVPHLLEGA